MPGPFSKFNASAWRKGVLTELPKPRFISSLEVKEPEEFPSRWAIRTRN